MPYSFVNINDRGRDDGDDGGGDDDDGATAARPGR
jgi:hypothetical protein